MLELFRERLLAVDASLHVVDEPSALPGLVKEQVQGSSVVAWEEALAHMSSPEWLAGASGSLAPASQSAEDMRARASSAEVSLIVADVGIAETGQIGFAHTDRRPREFALLPDRQIALLARQNLVSSTQDALTKLFGHPAQPPPNVVFIAGPSRTADIEQRMMLGVHAPRSLDVIVFG
jgi:L-lactate dehydrogenase complex protein LldG